MLDTLKAIESIATLFALGAGGLWALYKFRARRDYAPRIEFTANIEFIGVQGDCWLVEVLAFVDNRGNVQHNITEFAFSLRYLNVGDPVIEGGEEINYQVSISHLAKDGTWLPSSWSSTFIEPGLRTRYSYIAAVPREATFVLLHGRLNYEGARVLHTADRLLRVPDDPTEDASPPGASRILGRPSNDS